MSYVLFTQAVADDCVLRKEFCVCKKPAELLEKLKDILMFHVTGGEDIDIVKEYGEDVAADLNREIAKIAEYENASDAEIIDFIENYTADLLDFEILVVGLFSNEEDIDYLLEVILPSEIENIDHEELQEAMNDLRCNLDNYEFVKESVSTIYEFLCKH